MRLPQQPIRWTALPRGGVRPAPAAVMPHLSPVRPRNVGCPLLPGAEATPSSSLACRGSQDFEVLRGARWVAGSAGFPVTYEVTGVTCEWFERKEPCSHLSQMPFVTNVCVVDVSHLFSRVCHMPDRMTVSTMTVHREGFSCREQTRRLRHLESRPLCLLQWAAVPREASALLEAPQTPDVPQPRTGPHPPPPPSVARRQGGVPCMAELRLGRIFGVRGCEPRQQRGCQRLPAPEAVLVSGPGGKGGWPVIRSHLYYLRWRKPVTA